MALWNWPRWRPVAASALAALFIMLLFGNAGCGNKQLEDLANQAQQKIEQAKKQASDVSQDVKKAAENLPGAVAAVTAGEIKLTLDTPVNATTCSARFTPPAGDRLGVFQIGTSVTGGPQSFPAVFLHVPTSAASLQALVGQTLPAHLFVAKSESQGHYQSATDKPLSVQILKLENDVVTCQLQAAELACLDPGAPRSVPVAGTLIGAVRP